MSPPLWLLWFACAWSVLSFCGLVLFFVAVARASRRADFSRFGSDSRAGIAEGAGLLDDLEDRP